MKQKQKILISIYQEYGALSSHWFAYKIVLHHEPFMGNCPNPFPSLVIVFICTFKCILKQLNVIRLTIKHGFFFCLCLFCYFQHQRKTLSAFSALHILPSYFQIMFIQFHFKFLFQTASIIFLFGWRQLLINYFQISSNRILIFYQIMSLHLLGQCKYLLCRYCLLLSHIVL